MKKNVLVVTGTRAEYGLLKSVIDEILKSRILQLKLLVTGIHTIKKYGYTINEIKKHKLSIDCVVKVSEKDDMLSSLVKEIVGIKKYCIKEKPDLILILGDRDEPFAAAIVAGHLKIPIAHIGGGDVTGYAVDDTLRNSITKFGHLHFVATEKSKKRVIEMGEDKERVFNVGAVGLDGLSAIKFISKNDLAKKFNLDKKKYWILIIHHPTPFDNVSMESQIVSLFEFVSKMDAQKIVIYPNSDTGSEIFIKEIEKYKNKKDFSLFKNLPREDYLNFLKVCDLMVGNSSSGIIESTYFKIPVVNIGNRQLGREKGENIIDSDYGVASIEKAIKKAMSKEFVKKARKANSPYNGENTSRKIIEVIEKEIKNKNLFFKNK